MITNLRVMPNRTGKNQTNIHIRPFMDQEGATRKDFKALNLIIKMMCYLTVARKVVTF